MYYVMKYLGLISDLTSKIYSILLSIAFILSLSSSNFKVALYKLAIALEISIYSETYPSIFKIS